MKIKFNIRKIILFLFTVMLISVASMSYNKYISPTKIAFVNYKGFQLGRIESSNNNAWISVNSLSLDKLEDMGDYDAVIIFGMGLKLNDNQISIINKYMDEGLPIHTRSATNKAFSFNTLEGHDLDMVAAYLTNGGTKNYRNLLNYIRNSVDNKKVGTKLAEEPEEIADDLMFHLDEEATFRTFDAYLKYYKEKGFYKQGAPRVAILTSIPGPFNTNRDHIDAIISAFEKRNYNTFPISSFFQRTRFLAKVNPDLIVYMAHGRLNMMNGDKGLQYLKKQGVPILCPISVHQQYDKWLTDKQGMVGGLLSQTVTMPEFDGGIVPYTIVAEYRNDKGFDIFKVIPNRLEKFMQIADGFVSLQTKKNKDKKIAVYYFKGPGKNAMVASNMEVLPSMYNMLKRMQAEGYNLNGLPNNFKDFAKEIMIKGPVLGAYAHGTFNEYLKNGDPALVPVATYNKWRDATIPAALNEDVDKRYGKAPGEYMSVSKGDEDFIAVTRLRYGNVVLLPQPLPGLGSNTYALVHGAKVAPPHPYIASYLWTNNEFKSDAIIHFGTHGSLEFTPGKQIALSDYDWTDILIGQSPHFYVYTVSNVGEAMIAKRRSYTTCLSHLTPSFVEGGTYGKFIEIMKSVRKYQTAGSAQKESLAGFIKEQVILLGVNKELGLDSIADTNYSQAEMLRLCNYLEEISESSITGGLYTLGEPYKEDRLRSSVRQICIDQLAYSKAKVDILNGYENETIYDNKVLFNNKYRNPMSGLINYALAHPLADIKLLISKAGISNNDYARYSRWEIKHPSKKSSRRARTKTKSVRASKDQIKRWVVSVMADEVSDKFFKKLASDLEFERASKLLRPSYLKKVKKMGNMISAMKDYAETFERIEVKSLVENMQDSLIKVEVFAMFANPDFKSEIEIEKKNKIKSALEFLSSKESKQLLLDIESLNVDVLDIVSATKLDAKLKSVISRSSYWDMAKKFADKAALIAETKTKVELRIQKLNDQETEFAEAVKTIESHLSNINVYYSELKACPTYELDAVMKGLRGAFIEPTPGGDPISNPNIIPTGRNLTSVNAEATPSKYAMLMGKKLADGLIESFRSKHDGAYPKKVSFTLWSSSFIETEGATIAQILNLLGVEPVLDYFKRVKSVRLIPIEKLGRPRIDVVVQTSGQLRDLAASRLFLINDAIALVAEAAKHENGNAINTNILEAEKLLIKEGFSPLKARELSKARIFGGVNGNYGTGVMNMVESGDKWNSSEEVAKQYINNMGAVYGSSETWGEHTKGVFEAALINTEAVVQPRQSNTWGALSLDHVYEFMGGINLAVKEVTGKDPDAYFSDYRNMKNPKVQALKEAIGIESRSTLLNPKYIKEYMEGGASSAENFAETFRNVYGWNVMKPSVIDKRLWDDLYDVYVKDKHNLKVQEFFEKENPYALQEITAVMLETVRKGMWKASKEQIAEISKLHVDLLSKSDAGCSGFVCNNAKLRDYISDQISTEQLKTYNAKISKVREISENKSDNLVLKKEEINKPQKNKSATTEKVEESSTKKIIILVIAIILLLLFIISRRKKA